MARHFITALLVIISFLIATGALATPTKLSQQGRLLDGDGQPLDGTHALVFNLFTAEVDGDLLWTETHELLFDRGYYWVTLGAEVPLDDLLFAEESVWLGLQVDEKTLLPLQEIVAVPYALRATAAEHLEGGLVDAAEISIDGTVVIDASGSWVGPIPTVGWGDVADIPADIADGDQDTDTLAGLACAEGQLPKWDAASSLWVCGDEIDTQLTDAQVAAAATAQGFVAGAHTADTNTQLTEAQVDTMVANNNYSTGPHIVETDPVYSSSAAFTLSPWDITAWDTAYGWGDHSTEGYLTPETAVTTIVSKPFLLRSSSGSYAGSLTGWQTVSTLSPLTSGNHLTPTSITVSCYSTSGAYMEARYVMHYADGTSYYSESYGTGTGNWQSLAEGDIPVHAGIRGTVTTIDVQVKKSNASAWGAHGRVEVSGFETAPAGLTETKPFLLRSSSGSYAGSLIGWQTVSTLSPLTSGNHLTPTSVTVSCYSTSGAYMEVRYGMHYADGTSYYSESYGLGTGDWQTLTEDEIPIHAGMRGTVINIDVQVKKTNASAWGAHGRVEVSGFETIP